jgi:cytochrome c-type biogenesis protein CcmH/NrfG
MSIDTSRAAYFVSTLLLLAVTAWPRDAVSQTAGDATAAALKRDTARCSTQADVEACYNAIRRNPNDPALLVALGDALVRAQRFEDAIRNYRRAAVIAPGMSGTTAKISAAEEKMASRRAPVRPTGSAGADKRFSNAAPEAQSH